MIIGNRGNGPHLHAANSTPFDLWGHNNWCNQEVAGESHYLPALERLLRVGAKGLDEFETTVARVPCRIRGGEPGGSQVTEQGLIPDRVISWEISDGLVLDQHHHRVWVVPVGRFGDQECGAVH